MTALPRSRQVQQQRWVPITNSCLGPEVIFPLLHPTLFLLPFPLLLTPRDAWTPHLPPFYPAQQGYVLLAMTLVTSRPKNRPASSSKLHKTRFKCQRGPYQRSVGPKDGLSPGLKGNPWVIPLHSLSSLCRDPKPQWIKVVPPHPLPNPQEKPQKLGRPHQAAGEHKNLHGVSSTAALGGPMPPRRVLWVPPRHQRCVGCNRGAEHTPGQSQPGGFARPTLGLEVFSWKKKGHSEGHEGATEALNVL